MITTTIIPIILILPFLIIHVHMLNMPNLSHITSIIHIALISSSCLLLLWVGGNWYWLLIIMIGVVWLLLVHVFDVDYFLYKIYILILYVYAMYGI